MSADVKIFENPEKLGAGIAEEFASVVSDCASHNEKVNIAISGGNTPKIFFNSLTKDYKNKIDWNYVYIYWVDERCVAPDDNDSNYKMTKENFLDLVGINSGNIYRIRGEANPSEEAQRYSGIVKAQLPEANGLPQFDIIILGMGSDGHIASIFPGQLELFETNLIYTESVNPISGQKRITASGKIINNAKRVYFLVSGRDKAEVLEQVIRRQKTAGNFPACHIQPSHGSLTWFIDKDAAGWLK